MRRFLLFFSYIGSGFRGIQRQIPRYQENFATPIVPTVAEVIESCFKKILYLDKLPILHTASRTDAGVHALRSAGHIDLDLPTSSIYDVILAANIHFSKISCPIRIISGQRVKDQFNSRAFPVQRRYLYRFAVKKANLNDDNLKKFTPVPVTEYLRCHYCLNEKFDIDAVNEVLPLFRGVRNFRTFMGSLGPTKKRAILEQDIITVRELHSIEVTPGHPFLPSPLDENFDYWNFTCASKSFLYKQVRRMVATLISVGNGTLTYNDVEYMFDNPASSSWNPRSRSAPPYGLYLTDVIYSEEDLIPPEEEEEIKSTDIKTNPKDLVGLTINEKINLRLEKLKLQKSEAKLDKKKIQL